MIEICTVRTGTTMKTYTIRRQSTLCSYVRRQRGFVVSNTSYVDINPGYLYWQETDLFVELYYNTTIDNFVELEETALFLISKEDEIISYAEKILTVNRDDSYRDRMFEIFFFKSNLNYLLSNFHRKKQLSENVQQARYRF